MVPSSWKIDSEKSLRMKTIIPRRIFLFLPLFLLLISCGGSGGGSAGESQSTSNEVILDDQARKDISDMQQIQEIILTDMGPTFAPADDLDTTFSIRDYIYRRIPVANTIGFSFDDFLEAFEQSAVVGHLCQGIAINYVMAMESLGVPARTVEMYAEAVNANIPVLSHAVVDVNIAGRWVAIDPTYNASFWADETTPIGWQQVRERCFSGDPVYISDDGYSALREDIDEIPYCDYIDFMVFSPKRLDDGYYDGFVFPDSWDGIIRYEDGYAQDVHYYPDYDLRLAEAPWR